MYSTTGLEANDLVNFYNSNLLDEMLQNNKNSNSNKFVGKNNSNSGAKK